MNSKVTSKHEYRPAMEGSGDLQQRVVAFEPITVKLNKPIERENNLGAEGAQSENWELNTLINQIGFIRELTACEDIAEFNQKIMTIVNNFGFSDYALVRMSTHGAVGLPYSSLPDALAEQYHAARFSQYDMVLDYLKTGNTQPLFLSSIADTISNSPVQTHTFKRNLEIHELYKRFAINDIYMVPVKANRGDDQILFSVMAKDSSNGDFKDVVELCAPVLKLLADAINFIGDTKFRVRAPEVMVKPRPLRLLTTMAKFDLTLSQAAGKLCISLDTANKHMALAKKSLGTNSQANAVFLALKQGLISFEL